METRNSRRCLIDPTVPSYDLGTACPAIRHQGTLHLQGLATGVSSVVAYSTALASVSKPATVAVEVTGCSLGRVNLERWGHGERRGQLG